MTQWVAFAGIVALLTGAMVILSFLTQRAVVPANERVDSSELDAPSTDADADPKSGEAATGHQSARRDPGRTPEAEVGERQPVERTSPPASDPAVRSLDGSADEGARTGRSDEDGATMPFESDPADRVVAYVGDDPVTSRGLLANVAATQGLFLALVVGAIFVTGVPVDALGIERSSGWIGYGLGVGLLAGSVLYVASEAASALARRFGVDHDEWLRESLAPSSARGWVGLYVGVLPLIAVFEEVLFRAVLIGAFSAGFDVSPWLLAIGSSVLFAVGHGIQGTAGIVVTGVIGFVLAVLFVLTGNLLVVVTAHYVLNACEFAVHEGLDVEWSSPSSG
ncbi:CPBP family intramembrane glutamic endopeptidase [Halovivax gelatinilyticus]|uniref:CPBP family intramembrane glutamic endopeptidase n=1 Tax=Halovivax gelatinilyticus TaxID=2961597 RepID=UPI0020CA3D63|nr:CPBP family intramembrane glutamic endopeptidase [Halovivax gelatinilyticus]